MKKVYMILAAATLMGIVVACNKEQLMEESQPTEEQELVTEIITAQISDNDTKVTINGSGVFAWNTGDEVAYYTSAGWNSTTNTEEAGATATFVTEGTREDFAVYPKSLVYDGSAYYDASISNHGQEGVSLDIVLPNTYALADIQDDKTQLPMIASNTTASDWSFRQLCGILRLTISNIPSGTSYIKVSFNGRKVSGEFSIASTVTPGTSSIVSESGTPETNDYIKITGFSSETSATVNIPLPVGTPYQDLIISAWNGSDVPLMAQVTPFSYTAARAHGKKVNSALTLGVFKRAFGKYCVFAPGNLQATTTDAGSSWTWDFAASQLQIIGAAPGNNKINGGMTLSVDNGTVDLFGWSTNANTYYGIWNDTESTHYSGSFVDWGNNIIGDYSAGTWRTPNVSEHVYVVSTREASTVAGTSNARYVTAQVNGISGLILFPDVYSHPAGVDNPVNINQANLPENNPYSTDNWALMEAKGCVFLPNTGDRAGAYVSPAARANYWAATNVNDTAASGLTVKDGGGVYPSDSDRKKVGRAVRLIHYLN